MEVVAFFAQWADKKKGKAGFGDLKNCIASLSEQDEEELLKHVVKDNPTETEFCSHWTSNPTHVLGSSLYVDLRKWLGAGKWCFIFSISRLKCAALRCSFFFPELTWLLQSP